jgi:hypothetical protein
MAKAEANPKNSQATAAAMPDSNILKIKKGYSKEKI